MTPETGVTATVNAATKVATTMISPLVGTTFSMLGIPIWGLLAGLLGAFFSYVPRASVDKRDIPSKLLGILSDAVLGGWLAVAIVNLVWLQQTGVPAIPIEVLCGIAGFGMQWLRKNFGSLFERLFGMAVAALSSTITSWRKSADTPGGSP